MRQAKVIFVGFQALLVVAFAVALRKGAMPLGVRGEWEWLRLPSRVTTTWLEVVTGLGGILIYSLIGIMGFRYLSTRSTRRREWLALVSLWISAVFVQVMIQNGAPEGYGLSKWALALSNPGSSGYYSVAKKQIRDPWKFLADYPAWIERQDSLHIGTHPPGLLLVQHVLLNVMETHPPVARAIMDHLPPSVEVGLSVIGPLPRADRATLALTGALTLLACASTVVPLYLLARSSLEAPWAWAVAAAWPLVPSSILFQPAADTAFPFLSATALALGAFAAKRGDGIAKLLAVMSGVIMGIGMMFTLAFLPVGLVVGLVLACTPGRTVRQRALLILMTGVGFLVITLAGWGISGANPFVIWWWNQRNHARFYVEYPRTYMAWLIANPVELAVGLGLPIAAWSLLAFRRSREIPVAAWGTLGVLVVLTLSGKNLSEVGRLWLPLMPGLLLLMGQGMALVKGGPKTLGMTLALIGIETLILEMTIQVVYPI